MPRLDENQRLRAIGMLQAGLAQNVVANHVSLAARCLGSKIGRIAGCLGLMLCSRSLLRIVLELIGVTI
jgi:hypothetical protein